MPLIISLFACYLVGSIPTSFLVGKYLKGIDIREYGSGNVGATNTARIVGKGWGLLVLAVDILKGLICATLVAKLFMRWGVPVDGDIYPLILGSLAITGHIWPVFLGFKGGKGIATSSGVFIGVAPKVLLIALIIWIIIFAWKRYVSLASIISAVSIPLTASFMAYPSMFVIISSAICAVTVYKHYPNIKRLVRGEEHAFEFKKHG
ncbi:MAG TPA: glycerol-3-phosphate 1-O-acyltransferase PlsY [Candidatus Omnitrophota bacterium]|nr:glycerol-3-phosphate 1-O-acyltransferase PlsY [Candidatus Omnitrophota bacterium]HOX10011.1 glycerol-3-phosphate 1-O-acyltransferase PlsY [Candidatus Omnitrophota bacterium]